MSILALGALPTLLFAGLLLFGALVVLQFTMSLLREVKDLRRRIGGARERLHEAAGAVGVETAHAFEQRRRIEARRRH